MKEFSVSPANGNEYAFYCIPCKKNVSCSHQGFSDVKRHKKSTNHVNMPKAITDNRKVSHMFALSTRETELRDAVTRAEVLHTNLIAQHNLFFRFIIWPSCMKRCLQIQKLQSILHAEERKRLVSWLVQWCLHLKCAWLLIWRSIHRDWSWTMGLVTRALKRWMLYALTFLMLRGQIKLRQSSSTCAVRQVNLVLRLAVFLMLLITPLLRMRYLGSNVPVLD